MPPAKKDIASLNARIKRHERAIRELRETILEEKMNMYDTRRGTNNVYITDSRDLAPPYINYAAKRLTVRATFQSFSGIPPKSELCEFDIVHADPSVYRLRHAQQKQPIPPTFHSPDDATVDQKIREFLNGNIARLIEQCDEDEDNDLNYDHKRCYVRRQFSTNSLELIVWFRIPSPLKPSAMLSSTLSPLVRTWFGIDHELVAVE